MVLKKTEPKIIFGVKENRTKNPSPQSELGVYIPVCKEHIFSKIIYPLRRLKELWRKTRQRRDIYRRCEFKDGR